MVARPFRRDVPSAPALAGAAPDDYLEMSRGLAQSGIEKWMVDTGRMTMTFSDKAGREIVLEQIS